MTANAPRCISFGIDTVFISHSTRVAGMNKVVLHLLLMVMSYDMILQKFVTQKLFLHTALLFLASSDDL